MRKLSTHEKILNWKEKKIFHSEENCQLKRKLSNEGKILNLGENSQLKMNFSIKEKILGWKENS